MHIEVKRWVGFGGSLRAIGLERYASAYIEFHFSTLTLHSEVDFRYRGILSFVSTKIYIELSVHNLLIDCYNLQVEHLTNENNDLLRQVR